MSHDADVLIIGAGLAGATTATLLARSGVEVMLIDRHAECPACFKAEKVEPDQAELLRTFGMFDTLRPTLGAIDEVKTVRRGEVSQRTVEQYGGYYHDIVNHVRRGLPADVDPRIGRVTKLSTSATRQSVTLSDGTVLTARLLVLASGATGQLGAQLGLQRRMISEHHSLSFGFSIARIDDQPFDFDSINVYSQDPQARVGYVTLFAFPDGEMRANLFTYWDPQDPRVKEMLRQPKMELERLFPELAAHVGAFRVTTKVSTGVRDLYDSVGHRQAGVVLIGDSYQGACPSTGSGLSKVLTDVDVLCHDCIPRWLATPEMGVEKIDEFYDSPAKRASDRFALGAALHGREVALGSTRFSRLQQTGAWRRAVRFVKHSSVLEPVGLFLYDRTLSIRGRTRDGPGR
jgi:2-polyprenyl-6-methoxyphenol hydroxylase-like FAD-dependent oxidoreductase